MSELLTLAFVFLLSGIIFVPMAARLGLGSVTGYLIAGVLISPLLALLHVDVVAIQHFAEFGVVMMLFLVGLELEPKRLWQMRNRILGLGGLQVTLTAAGIMGVAMALGQPWTVSLAIGLILALSSTAIVLQTLSEKGLIKSEGGQASFSVLLFQDAAVIPMLAVLPLLAQPELADVLSHGAEATSAGDHGSGDHARGDHGGNGQGAGMSLVAGLSGGQQALITLSAIAFTIIGGSLLARPMFRFIGQAQLREISVAAALLWVIGIALLMTLVGLSPALGTFLAGVVLANSEYRHELESHIDPFKGLLLGLFFITVGAGVDFGLLFDQIDSILFMTFGLIGLKALVLYALASALKLRDTDRWLFSLGLAQVGELAFVLLSFAVANGTILPALADQLLIVVALSMLLTPLLWSLGQVLAEDGAERTRTGRLGELKVFISYSRHDSQRMHEIAACLEMRGFAVTYDTRDLPFGEKWQAELRYFIEQSDMVIWLVSRSSIESYWCKWELEQILKLRKKLIPLAIGPFKPKELPEHLKEIHILPTEGQFSLTNRDHMRALTNVLGNDYSWVKLYTRLSDRALAWDRAKRDSDRLLTLTELEEAEAWQAEQSPLAPEPMPLVLDLIHSSRVVANRGRIS